MTYTFIVATSGRPTLFNTLRSIKPNPDDEILVVGELTTKQTDDILAMPCTKVIHFSAGHNWGHSERNTALTYATKQMLSFMDDDDIYALGARSILETADPTRPSIFRMQAQYGDIYWKEPVIIQGNIGTPMIVMPNDIRIGRFGNRYEGDYDFLRSSQWNNFQYAFRGETIALIRPHNWYDSALISPDSIHGGVNR